MPRRLLLALLILVAAPLVLLGWISATAMRWQQDAATAQLEDLLRDRLDEIDRDLSNVFQGYERRLSQRIEASSQVIETLRRLKLDDPVVRQGIFVSKDGLLLHPAKPTADDPEMISLHAALSSMIGARPDLGDGGDESLADTGVKSKDAASESDIDRRVNRTEWQTWYLDEGAQLILWFARDDSASAGVLLDRSRWMSDLTAALPDSKPSFQRDSSAGARQAGITSLWDESGQLIYRWGDNEPIAGAPAAAIAISAPLSTWQLRFHATKPLIPPISWLPVVLSLLGIGIVLLALGFYVLTGVRRQMRTALRRVTFAGQVSHELRTPLTNILLYTELAEADLQKMPDSSARNSIEKRLGVIDTESRRLCRLVSGVLEMIRDDGKQRPPLLSSAVPDELIRQTLEQFEPSFARSGIEVTAELSADQQVNLDPDILELVLVNLLSNVEKYAADGKRVDISSQLSGDTLSVSVADYGQGIAPRYRNAVFRPFSRLDDSISAPSGTGIGLAIARRAAQRHGGQLVLVPCDHGACFQFRIPIQR